MYHHAPGLPPRGIPPRAQGIMGARRMPWHRKSTKGAASRDRPGGGANGPRSRDSRMGEPSRRHGRLPDWSSGERKRASPNLRRRQGWGRCLAGVAGRDAPGPQARARVRKPDSSGTAWEGRPQRVRAPYAKGPDSRLSIQSRAGHVKPGPKQGGPPSKAEHSPMTDSEPVPRGKGEKHPERGVKQRLKPCAPKQREPFRRR